jgi:hypothetical protein
LGGAFAGLLEEEGFALGGENLGVVDEAVDEGDDADGVGEDPAPLGGYSLKPRQFAPSWRKPARLHNRLILQAVAA